MSDENGVDCKLICVPTGDPNWSPLKDLEDLPSLLRAEIEQFFTIYKELGGRRAVTPESPNDGWQVAAFRGYAGYLRTSEFATGKARLAGLATERRTAIMCAEAVP